VRPLAQWDATWHSALNVVPQLRNENSPKGNQAARVSAPIFPVENSLRDHFGAFLTIPSHGL